MLFDRHENHIQAFLNFISGKLMSGHSSSSTCHDFKTSSFLIIKTQKINLQSSNLQIFTFLNSKIKKIDTPYFKKCLKFQMVRRINISQDVSIFSCNFWNNLVVNTGFKSPLWVQKMSKCWKFQKSSEKYCNMTGDLN